MDTVLYFQSPAKTSAPYKLAGVQEITDINRIHLQVIEEPPTRKLIAGLTDFWHPAGAIVDCGGEYNDINAGIFDGIVTVFLGHDPDTLPSKCLHVMNNQQETARIAARELLETGFANFAYVPFAKKRYWSEARRKAFCEAISLNGRKCSVFSPPNTDDTESLAWINALKDFTASLPKPCAVFAANDRTAESVLSAARLAKVAVPGELAVVGVDNHTVICEHTSPPLTSIEPDFQQGGRLAAMMLLAATRGSTPWRGKRTAMFGPLKIARRGSSRLLLRQDPHAIAALDLIRREACTGLKAAKVAALFPCSRRMADLRFSRATGHTILDEIHAAQLDRAKEILKNKNIQLKAISDFCGFTHPNSLRKFFLKQTGKTLSAWRAEHMATTVL